MVDEKDLVEQVEESPALEGIQELDEAANSDEETTTEAPVQKQEQKRTEDVEYVRRLREAKDESERRERDLLRRLEAIERNQASSEQMPKEPEEDLNFSINPDELAEGKHLLKISKRMQKMEQDYAKRLDKYEQQAAQVTAEAQLRSRFPDIDKVINSDTIAVLVADHPEIMATLNSNPDIYSKSVAAYTLIKRLGIHKDEVAQENQHLLNQNNAKPRSSSSLAPQRSNSPLSQVNAYANGLTKADKEQARRELAAILGR